MAQGNPFGPPGGTWIDTARLRALFEANVAYDDIARLNEIETGWRPNKATVMHKGRELGFDKRNASHGDLIPWRVSAEHNRHRYRHMLNAESRRRQGLELSATDQKLIRILRSLLSGGGPNRTQLVIGYDLGIGWYLTDRADEDDDIIRRP